MQSEIEKAEEGIRNLVKDYRNWKPKTNYGRRIKNALEIASLVALVVVVIYVVAWVMFHLLKW